MSETERNDRQRRFESRSLPARLHEGTGTTRGEPEGYSIPAQREACKRKAESLGAAVVEEFADRGESARSADRPELQALLPTSVRTRSST